MNQSELQARVISLISSELGVSGNSLTTATKSSDIDKWDSLGHLQICMALEAEFGVSPGLSEIAELDSVASIIDYLQQAF